jgi:hypothetical protein
VTLTRDPATQRWLQSQQRKYKNVKARRARLDTRHANKLYTALREYPSGLTRSEILHTVFGSNRNQQVDNAIATLVKEGRIYSQRIPTATNTMTLYYAGPSNDAK